MSATVEHQVLTYNARDAARITGLSRSGIYERIKAGKLRAIRSEGRVLIPADELRRYLDEMPAYEPDDGYGIPA